MSQVERNDGIITHHEVINEMQRIAPPHQTTLDKQSVEGLRSLTSLLISVHGRDSLEEFERFQGIKQRGLSISEESIRDSIEGRTILVTGGTGCIGSVLLDQLTYYDPGRIVSVSRGLTVPVKQVVGVEYVSADIRDKESLEDIVSSVKPQIIYHLAAQRDPSLAERAMRHTLTTNIEGTKNVIDTAQHNDVEQLVYASTGKAMRPFSPDTYASSKKVSEWLLSQVAAKGDMLVSGVRFTHVVDNSIIHKRVQEWIRTDSTIRLHGVSAWFYMQSALESTHLLLNSTVEAKQGIFMVHAINDLERPINLVDFAVGVVADAHTITPIYIAGYEPGYEEIPYPGIYDLENQADTSPLINSFEASETTQSVLCPQVDTFPFTMPYDELLQGYLESLQRQLGQGAPDNELHLIKDQLSWKMLEVRLRDVPQGVLQRIAKRMKRIPTHFLIPEHEETNRLLYEAVQES